MPRTTEDGNPHPVDVIAGQRVRLRREELGYNQSDLGRALGLTFQQVQKYERASNRMSASKLSITAKFLGVPVSYFFEEDDTIVPVTLPGHNMMATKQGREIAAAWPNLPNQARLAIAMIAEAFDIHARVNS